MATSIQIALLCCYPLFVHISVVLQDPLYRVLALIILTSGILFKGLIRKNWAAWLGLLAITVVTFIIAQFDQWLYLFYIPPVLIPVLIGSTFLRSLLPGNEPLVTLIAERARGPLPEKLKIYTRQVTLLWVIVLCIMTMLGVVLPVFASEPIWSIYTNFVSYILIAIVFIGEYLYRRIRFIDYNHPSFRQYLLIVSRSRKPNHRHD